MDEMRKLYHRWTMMDGMVKLMQEHFTREEQRTIARMLTEQADATDDYARTVMTTMRQLDHVITAMTSIADVQPSQPIVRRWTGATGDADFQNPKNWEPEGVPATVEEMDHPGPPPDALYGLSARRASPRPNTMLFQEEDGSLVDNQGNRYRFGPGNVIVPEPQADTLMLKTDNKVYRNGVALTEREEESHMSEYMRDLLGIADQSVITEAKE